MCRHLYRVGFSDESALTSGEQTPNDFERHRGCFGKSDLHQVPTTPVDIGCLNRRTPGKSWRAEFAGRNVQAICMIAEVLMRRACKKIGGPRPAVASNYEVTRASSNRSNLGRLLIVMAGRVISLRSAFHRALLMLSPMLERISIEAPIVTHFECW